jgi:hypothetical protein
MMIKDNRVRCSSSKHQNISGRIIMSGLKLARIANARRFEGGILKRSIIMTTNFFIEKKKTLLA